MFQEIKKELLANVTEGCKKLIRLGVKFVIFVLACWMTIGALAIGILVPLGVIQSVSTQKTVETTQISEPAISETVQTGPVVSRMNYANPAPLQTSVSVRRNVRQPDLRSQIRETRGTVSDIRNLGNSIESLVRL